MILSLLVCSLLSDASIAAVEPTPVLIVSVPRDNASKRAAQYMSYGFRSAVKRDERFAVAHLGPLYGDKAIDQSKLESDAEALVTEGLAAYDNLETEKAQQKFEQALGSFESSLGELDSTKGAARISLLAAAAAVNNGADKQGRALMQRALLYELGVSPDPRVYNANMMATFKDVRTRAGKGQKGSLAVASNPSYGELYIDGEFIGTTPDKINSIDSGPHLVRVVRDGYRPLAQVVEVKPGRSETSVTLALVGMPEIRQMELSLDKTAGEVKEKKPSEIDALIQKGLARVGVLCAVSSNGDQVKAEVGLFNANGDKLAYLERTFSASAETYREEAERLWQELLTQAGPGLMGGGGPITGGTRIDERVAGTSNLRPIVTWGLVGLGGVSLIVGGTMGILAISQQSRFKNLNQLDPRVPNEQSGIKAKAVVADVMVGLGVAAATAGVLCLFLWKDRAPTQSIVELEPLDFMVTPDGAAVAMRGRF